MRYIYTVITGEKDILNEHINSDGAHLVCFTDQDITSEIWEIRKIPSIFKDVRRDSRLPKLLPHIFLPDAEYSLYIDGNITFKVPLRRLIDEWLTYTDIAFFKHGVRDCYFEEAKECIRLGLDDPEVITQQVIRYKDYPRHSGLYQGGVILRKHTDKVRQFNESWWAEYCIGSRRDQISLPIAIQKTGIAVSGINSHPFHHPYFEMVPHKKPSEWAGKI